MRSFGTLTAVVRAGTTAATKDATMAVGLVVALAALSGVPMVASKVLNSAGLMAVAWAVRTVVSMVVKSEKKRVVWKAVRLVASKAA